MTRIEVIHAALRRLGVLSADEAATADMERYCGDALDALFAELPFSEGFTITWTLDTVPSSHFLPLAFLLAVEVGPHYMVPTERRSRAMGRLRAVHFSDDRADSRDLDKDGTVTEAEEEAAKRAGFY